MWQSIADQVSATLHSQFVIHDKYALSGEPHARRMLISDGTRSLFVKFAPRYELERLECQQHALEELGRYQAIHIPHPICCGTVADTAFLATEYFPLHEGSSDEWLNFGAALAKLHQSDIQAMYGWDDDNFLGHTPQPNRWQKQWSTFFAEQRIGWFMQLIREKQTLEFNIDDVVEVVRRRLVHHQPKPSPLHGNLQPSNLGFTPTGGVLFDLASFFGDRELDLARLELSNPLPPAFFQGYDAIWPRSEGYLDRQPLYQLTYLLQQFAEQGEPCRQPAETALRQLLAS